MGRKRHRRELCVAMNGSDVGRLEHMSGGALRFSYTREWLASAAPIPISLSMPLSPDPYSGDVVPGFFDNMLPDNEEIRRRMQVSLGTESTRPFDLLAAAGVDCVGALQLFDSPHMPDVRRVEASPVSDAEIARMLRDYRRRPLGMAPEEDDFRISIAGAQEKTAFLWYRDAWHRPHGTTPTTHIFKLPIGVVGGGLDLSDSVENEWLCLRIAAELGLPVPAAEIRRFEDTKALVVERFDRRWADDGSWLIRLPQEDVCQSLGVSPGRKYESDGGPGIQAIMDLLLQSLQPHEDRRTFLRACVVYWMLAAIDGHAKNFSLFLLPHGRCRSTPLYDVISAQPLIADGQLHVEDLKMAMAVVGKNRHYRWQEIQRRHWLATAKQCKFPLDEMATLLDDCVARVQPVVDEIGASLPAGFPERVAEPIFNGLLAARPRADAGA